MARLELEREVRKFISAGSVSGGETEADLDAQPKLLVIQGNNNAPAQPKGVFATCLLVNDLATEQPIIVERAAPDDKVDLNHRQSRRARFSVQFFRDDGFDYAHNFMLYARSDIGALDANAVGFKVAEVSELRQIDAPVSEAWERRVVLDLFVDYWHDRFWRVESIGSLESEIEV